MTTLTVSQLNRYIKSVLDETTKLQNIYVSGEISNFKYYSFSGHMYFTIKDSTSQLKCVMFANDNARLRFMPENGMNVVCNGHVGVYEKDGVYQLYVQGMQPKGIGELSIAYEQLKENLQKRGWFAEERKKKIPKYPRKIGVATSNMGAAIEDIKNIISRRFPICDIIIVPTVVQGESAKYDIASSIEYLDSMNLDTIIVGRGGGSLEDLWAFNTIEVAQAIFCCNTPVISAVGHETDFTICDFVADLRASTPSAAAELAVPDITVELSNLRDTKSFLKKCLEHNISNEQQKLDKIVSSSLRDINSFLSPYESSIDSLSGKLNDNIKNIVERKDMQFSKAVAMLNALSPLAILGRGYSMTTLNDKPICNADCININDTIKTRLSNGMIISKVTEVIE